MAEQMLCRVVQFRDNAPGQYVAKLDAPLIERVDVPDSALGEHRMLVTGDELAKVLGRSIEYIGTACPCENRTRNSRLLSVIIALR